MTGSCWCGRSESGLCVGLHKFSEAEYKKFLEEKDKPKEERKLSDFEIEEKTSGGAVYEAGVRESKRSKAVRQIAQPLMDKYWKQDVTNLHRIYRVAEYLLKRSKRHK